MLSDLWQSIKFWRIWLYLPLQELKANYRESILGPYWSIFNILLFIVPICMLYGKIFNQDKTYFLYLLTGLVIWNFVAGIITNGLSSITSNAGILKEIKLPYCLFLLKSLVKQSSNFCHQLALYFSYLIFFSDKPLWTALLVFPAIILSVTMLFFWCFLGAMCVVYFRDLSQITTKFLGFLFLSSPVIWKSSPTHHSYIFWLQINPIAALLNLIRSPLLGTLPTEHDVSLVVLTTLTGFIMSSIAYFYTKNRLIFLI